MKYILDAGTRSVVGVCLEHGCGARVLAADRPGARALLADHCDRAHIGTKNHPRAVTRRRNA